MFLWSPCSYCCLPVFPRQLLSVNLIQRRMKAFSQGNYWDQIFVSRSVSLWALCAISGTSQKKKKKGICFIGITFHLVSALGCSCCKEKALNWIWASVYNVWVSFFVLRWCTVWTACKEFKICQVITWHGWHTFGKYWSERSGTLYLTDIHLLRVSSPACFVWCVVQSVGSHDHSLNGTLTTVLTRSLKNKTH